MLLIVLALVVLWAFWFFHQKRGGTQAPKALLEMVDGHSSVGTIFELREKILRLLRKSRATNGKLLIRDLDELIRGLTSTLSVYVELKSGSDPGAAARLNAAEERIEIAAGRVEEHFREALAGIIELLGVDLVPDVEPLRQYLAARRRLVLATLAKLESPELDVEIETEGVAEELLR